MENCHNYIPLMMSLFLQISKTTEALMDCTQVSGGYSSPSVVLILLFVPRIVSWDSASHSSNPLAWGP